MATKDKTATIEDTTTDTPAFTSQQFTLDQLVHGDNVRQRENFEIESLIPQLKFGKEARQIQSSIGFIREDGKVELWDGNRRLAALNSLAEQGFTIKPVPVALMSAEDAKDPMKRLEVQIRLGVSAKTLLPYEVAEGQVEWVRMRQAQLIANGVPEDKSLARAKKDAATTYGVSGDVINKAIQYIEDVPDLLKDATRKGHISGMFDAIAIYAAYTKTKEAGWTGELSAFFAVCENCRDKRGGKTVNGDDGKEARKQLEAEIKQQQVAAKIQSEDVQQVVQAGIEAGSLSSETLQDAAAFAEESGVPLDAVLQAAQDTAAEVQQPNADGIIIPTDEDVQRTIKSQKLEQAQNVGEMSTDAMLKQLQEFAFHYAVLCGGDPTEFIKTLKKRINEHEGMFIEDYDAEGLTATYTASVKFFQALDRTQTRVVKRVEKAAKAEQIAAANATLDALPSKEGETVAEEATPEEVLEVFAEDTSDAEFLDETNQEAPTETLTDEELLAQ